MTQARIRKQHKQPYETRFHKCYCLSKAVPRLHNYILPKNLQLVKLSLAAVFLFLPALGRSWGRQGHATIALVAERLMNPAAKHLVDQLRQAPGWEALKPGNNRYFRSADEDLIRFCQGPDADLSLVAEWADAWRESHPETASWHYVDTPLDSDGSPQALTLACGSGCILTRLESALSDLRNAGGAPLARLEALLWVTHLVGDIEQPLHCAERDGDKGGNSVGVFVGGRVGNLHSAWDTGFFYVEHARPKELAADLLAHECVDVLAEKGESIKDPAVWAGESFAVAKNFVYPQVEGNGGHFSGEEVARAWPVVRLQLARAGVRLAEELNWAAGNTAADAGTSGH